jgi:pyruvate/2-oxoglutarate/acetoin dehydrogenase E1 component
MMQFKAILLSVVAWLGSGANWAALRPLIIDLLKQAWVRTILLQIFGGMISGGYQAWIAKLIVEYAFDTLALPVVKLTFRKMGYVYHKTEGAIIFKRIEEAKANNDEKKYDQAVDDLFRN